ncbi:hypothetical protein ES703_10252 [subsurface metagenome]
MNNYGKIKETKRNLTDIFGVEAKEIKAKIINIEHHRAHIASSFFVSHFKEAAVVSIDGFGDFVCAMIGVGKENKINVIDVADFCHSFF